jgi:hypothetical protein
MYKMIWYPAVAAKAARGDATKSDMQYANSVDASP